MTLSYGFFSQNVKNGCTSRKQHGHTTTTDLQRKALELVLLDEFVKVYAEKFKGHAYVIPEREALQHVDDVHRVVLFVCLRTKERVNEIQARPRDKGQCKSRQWD